MHRRILHILLQTDLLKTGCVKTKTNPLYPPWDWAEKSEGFFSPELTVHYFRSRGRWFGQTNM